LLERFGLLGSTKFYSIGVIVPSGLWYWVIILAVLSTLVFNFLLNPKASSKSSKSTAP